MLYNWRSKKSSVNFSCAYELILTFAVGSPHYSVQLFKNAIIGKRKNTSALEDMDGCLKSDDSGKDENHFDTVESLALATVR